MKIHTQISIEAPKEKIWPVITDIEGAVDRISAIEKVEILNKPENGLEGLKWKETRTLFGKSATETMWITDAVEYQSYQTRAENHGAVYISRIYMTEANGRTILNMDFEGTPQTLGGKIMSAIMGIFFKGATKKALMKDLEDIKTAVESSA